MDENTEHFEDKEKLLQEALHKEEKSVTSFFIKNYRFTYLIIFAVLILGVFSLITLPREADPEVKIPIAVVTTIYPGGTPVDMEELITDEIEKEVKNLDDLKTYSSASGQGVSSIVVEFNAEADLKNSYQKLRDAVDLAKPKLPSEAEDPVVTEIRVSDFPIVTYSILCDSNSSSECDIEKYTDLIQNELEGINGVSKVEIVGETEREFQVIVDQTKLATFNLSLGQIVNAIARTNFNLPAGNIEIENFNYNVRVKGKFDEAQALNDIVITTYQDIPIFISDVAEVKDGIKEIKTASRIGAPGQDINKTVSFQIYKQTGGNILKIVEKSESTIARLQAEKIPDNLKIIKTDDNSSFIQETLGRLSNSGMQTMILIVMILFAVLGLRGAIITGLSVPIAFLMAFVVLNIQGNTLNSIVLYSLVISLGLMVDNSIIIMEGINEYIAKHNKTPLQAAILSVWNFKWAITSGTLTTVSAFLPMLLVSGILGEYFSFIPKTITATLLSSLFVALIVIPTLSARYLKVNKKSKEEYQNGEIAKRKSKKVGKQYQLMCHIIDRVKEVYEKKMKNILVSKKKRRLTMSIAWLLFVISVSIPAFGFMKINMFPPVDFDTVWIAVKLPVGSTLDKTKEKSKEIESIVAQIPEMKSYTTNLGVLLSFNSGNSSGSHLATIALNLVPDKERDRKSFEISDEIRSKIKNIQGAEISVEQAQAGPPTGAPIEVRVFGDDIKELTFVSENVMQILDDIDGTRNINSNIEDAAGEFTFTINKQQANYYGLDIVTVASTLRNAIYGTTASTVTLNGEDIDITVKYAKDKFTNINDLEDLLIFTPRGENIPLKQIADLSLEPSLLRINHLDGKKVVKVTAEVNEDANLQKILANFDNKKNDIVLKDNFSIEVGGEVEDIEQSYRELFLSMIVAIILIAFILVLQFNSFRQPLIILSALPLAIIGVIIGLNLLRMPFSFPAFLGIVSLGGIAVNDAIVLIDRINKNLRMGMDWVDGIIEGSLARMQPIFLTSLTTIAGIFPLIFADEIWKGFSITVIFGLIFSTVLTLIIVPILYISFTRHDRFVTEK